MLNSVLHRRCCAIAVALVAAVSTIASATTTFTVNGVPAVGVSGPNWLVSGPDPVSFDEGLSNPGDWAADINQYSSRGGWFSDVLLTKQSPGSTSHSAEGVSRVQVSGSDGVVLSGPAGSVSTSYNIDVAVHTQTGINEIWLRLENVTTRGITTGRYTSPVFTATVGVPISLDIVLLTGVAANDSHYSSRAAATANFPGLDDSAALSAAAAAVGPVFNLPPGYTADCPALNIVNNMWTGVPEPSSLSLLALGGLTLLRRRRQC